MSTVMLDLQSATLDARDRTGDRRISTTVKRGLFSVVLVEYDARGRSTVTPLYGPAPASEVITYLRGYGA